MTQTNNEREAFERLITKDAWFNKLDVNLKLDETGTYEYKYDTANLIYSTFLLGREYQASISQKEQQGAVATYRVQVVRDDGSPNGKPHYKDTKETLERDLHYLHDDNYKTVVTPLFASPPKQAIPDGGLVASIQAIESEINSLKERVAELSELLKDRQSDLDFEFNRAEQNELECNALIASNNQLREALGKCKPLSRYGLVGTKDTEQAEFQKYIDTALSSTPAQSLAEHDNEVIERIATALENAEGEFKTLPEYVSLVRALKATP